MNVYIIKTSFNRLPTRLVICCAEQADDAVARLVMQHPAESAVLQYGAVPERDDAEKERAARLLQLLYAEQSSEDLDLVSKPFTSKRNQRI